MRPSGRPAGGPTATPLRAAGCARRARGRGGRRPRGGAREARTGLGPLEPPEPPTRAQVALSTALPRLAARPADEARRRGRRRRRCGRLPDRFVRPRLRRRRAGARGARRRRPAAARTSVPTLRRRRRASRSTRRAATCSFPTSCSWMVDFERAVAAGMGFAIDLTPAQASAGFDRLLVLGLRLGADRRGRPGRARGAPRAPPRTGAAASALAAAGHADEQHRAAPAPATRSVDDADASFDDRRDAAALHLDGRPDAASATASGWPSCSASTRRCLQRVHGSGGARPAARRGRCSARSGRRRSATGWRRCWRRCSTTPPSTTRAGSSRSYVSGRGAAARDPDRPPALRDPADDRVLAHPLAIGAARELTGAARFLRELHAAALRGRRRGLDGDERRGRRTSASPATRTRRCSTSLGLHPARPSSTTRYAESLSELYNIANLGGLGPDFSEGCSRSRCRRAGDRAAAAARLHRRAAARHPRALLPRRQRRRCRATSIDDRPLSETEPIRAYDRRTAATTSSGWSTPPARRSTTSAPSSGFTDDASPQRCSTCCCATR